MDFFLHACGGCKTCELACSYHHDHAFSYEGGSFELIERPEHDGYTVRIHEQAPGERPACDGCVGLEKPLCIRYCIEADDLQPLLREFLQKKSERT